MILIALNSSSISYNKLKPAARNVFYAVFNTVKNIKYALNIFF